MIVTFRRGDLVRTKSEGYYAIILCVPDTSGVDADIFLANGMRAMWRMADLTPLPLREGANFAVGDANFAEILKDRIT